MSVGAVAVQVELDATITNPWDAILYVATDAGAIFALEESGSSY